MGESTYEIEQEIGAVRYRLGQNIQELETRAKAMTDWRSYYSRHPLATLGVVFGGAAFLGMLAGRSARHRARGVVDASAGSLRVTTRSALAPTAERVRDHFGDTFDRIADALLGVASAKAIEFVADKVPGFRDQYTSRDVRQ